MATLSRAGIPEATVRTIFHKLFPLEDIHGCLDSLSGIVERNSYGRLIARHQLYVEHIIYNICGTDELKQSIVAILDSFSGFEPPIIKRVGKLDGQLFKYVLNNRFLYRTFSRRGKRDEAEEIYKEFDIKFQLDGHYWLHYGLFVRQLERHRPALDMFKRSLEAYPENRFAEHAYAQQLFILADQLPVGDPRSEKLVEEGVNRFLLMHSRMLPIGDRYPLITLAFYYLPYLLKNNRSEHARKQARDYFQKLKDFDKIEFNADVGLMRSALIKLATTGIWERPNLKADDELFLDA